VPIFSESLWASLKLNEILKWGDKKISNRMDEYLGKGCSKLPVALLKWII